MTRRHAEHLRANDTMQTVSILHTGFHWAYWRLSTHAKGHQNSRPHHEIQREARPSANRRRAIILSTRPQLSGRRTFLGGRPTLLCPSRSGHMCADGGPSVLIAAALEPVSLPGRPRRAGTEDDTLRVQPNPRRDRGRVLSARGKRAARTAAVELCSEDLQAQQACVSDFLESVEMLLRWPTRCVYTSQ